MEMLENKKWDMLFDFSYHVVIQIIGELYRKIDFDQTFMDAEIQGISKIIRLKRI